MARKKSRSSLKKIFHFFKGLSKGQKITLIVAIIGFIATIAAALIKIGPIVFQSKQPEFQLAKGVIYHPDSTIVVLGMNKSANQQKSIIFEIDGYCLHEVSNFIYQDKNFFWQIHLRDLNLPESVRKDGEHQVSFGFMRDKMSREQKIYFDSKSPQTFVRLEGVSTSEKRIYGQVVDESPTPDQNISVEVAFQHQEQLHTTQIPVKSYVDSSGRKMFEFEYQVQNIPQLSKDDPDYNQPFFAIKVTDEAGNEFHHSSTYGKFIAEGIETFGTKSAEILFQKVGIEKIPVAKSTTPSPQKQRKTRNIDDGEPLITLRVLIRTPNYVQLSWNRLPGKLRGARDEYVVLRQNRKIDTTSDTTYTDRNIAADSAYPYQILAKSWEEKYYPSNVVPVNAIKEEQEQLKPSLPIKAIENALSVQKVKLMLKNKNYFDSKRNPNGQGYANQFEVNKVNGDKIVIDGASGLMWQQAGSEKVISFEDIKKWIEALNQRGYAGFKDWRLPTLEEAMSLMEPERKDDNLYIDPVFNSRQKYIWTSDQIQGASWAWVVNFINGDCSNIRFYNNDYIRAVRSIQ